MSISVHRGGPYRYMLTSVQWWSTSVHVDFASTTLVHHVVPFRYRYINWMLHLSVQHNYSNMNRPNKPFCECCYERIVIKEQITAPALYHWQPGQRQWSSGTCKAAQSWLLTRRAMTCRKTNCASSSKSPTQVGYSNHVHNHNWSKTLISSLPAIRWSCVSRYERP